MIKKAIDTLKRKPIIILMLLVPFLWKAFGLALEALNIINMDSTTEYIGYGTASPTTKVYTWSIINAVYFIAWAIFLSAPAQYLIYEASIENVKKGWYKKGVSYWWRPLVLSLILGLLLGAVSLIFEIIFSIISFSSMRAGIYMIQNIITSFMTMMISVFMYIGNAGIFAEEVFNDGLGNIFKAGKRHFVKILGLTFVMLLPDLIYETLITAGIIDTSSYEIIIGLLLVLWQCVFLILISVFAMHCYLEYKDYAAKKRELLNEEDLELLEAEDD